MARTATPLATRELFGCPPPTCLCLGNLQVLSSQGLRSLLLAFERELQSTGMITETPAQIFFLFALLGGKFGVLGCLRFTKDKSVTD